MLVWSPVTGDGGHGWLLSQKNGVGGEAGDGRKLIIFAI